MSVKIEKKIVGYNVVKPVDESAKAEAPATQIKESLDAGSSEYGNIVQMHEKVIRPEMLIGNTYKIKTPVSEHAFYITINDILLNPGTPLRETPSL